MQTLREVCLNISPFRRTSFEPPLIRDAWDSTLRLRVQGDDFEAYGRKSGYAAFRRRGERRAAAAVNGAT